MALDGQIEPLTLRPKAVALLAYLALTNRVVERRELARLLFPGVEEPLASLRWHLNHLRAAALDSVTDTLTVTRKTVALSIQTDVARFLLGAATIVAHPDIADASDILALYRDDLLTGLAVSTSADFDNWLYVEQEALRRLFRRATIAFVRWALDNDRAADATAPLARLISVDPYCEDGHALLIEAYELLRERDHARAAYERYQHIMRRELHAEPRYAVARRFERHPARRCVEPQEEFVPLRDVTLHIVDWPGGDPAILGIHGSGNSAYALTALAERLAPTHRFVGVDLRGHGYSDKPPRGYALADHVGDLCQLIVALGLRHPVLLGHSAGGTVAAFVAAQTDVSGLVLLEAMIGDRAFTENAAAQSAPIAEAATRRYRGFDEYIAMSRAGRDRWGDEAERMQERAVRHQIAPLPDGSYRQRALRVAIEAEWASIVEADSLGALARVSCPILIVQAVQPWFGGRPYFTDEIVAAQMRAAPSAILSRSENSAHGSMVRNPEPKMIEAIRRLCGRGFSSPPDPSLAAAGEGGADAYSA